MDPQAFARTAAFLLPETVTSYLRTILALGDTLLRALDEADPLHGPTEALAAATHTLTGSAGMFGFQRLASLGQRFEHALQTANPEARHLAQQLRAAVTETRKDIEKRIG